MRPVNCRMIPPGSPLPLPAGHHQAPSVGFRRRCLLAGILLVLAELSLAVPEICAWEIGVIDLEPGANVNVFAREGGDVIYVGADEQGRMIVHDFLSVHREIVRRRDGTVVMANQVWTISIYGSSGNDHIETMDVQPHIFTNLYRDGIAVEVFGYEGDDYLGGSPFCR